MKYRFYILDVFTRTAFGGNQLAVLPDARGLSTDGMQQVARNQRQWACTLSLSKGVKVSETRAFRQAQCRHAQ